MALKITYHNKSRGGRPKADTEGLVLKVYYEAPKALNNEQLATYLDIATSTFYDLINDCPEFSEAIKHYRRISPIEVLNSFKKLCVGYSVDEVQKELRKNNNTGEYEMIVTKITTKHFKPDAAASIFYLKNQMPEQFKDKTETVITPGVGMESITFTAKRRESE
ncbi:MAG: hypothetical protein V4511_03010 [Bacteroidota bacterium]